MVETVKEAIISASYSKTSGEETSLLLDKDSSNIVERNEVCIAEYNRSLIL